ncbi:MAG: hypothetical protein U1F56_19185 [Rubrivivax sp.]
MNRQTRLADPMDTLPPLYRSECVPEDLDDPPGADAGATGAPWVVLLQAALPLAVGALGVVMPLV